MDHQLLPVYNMNVVSLTVPEKQPPLPVLEHTATTPQTAPMVYVRYASPEHVDLTVHLTSVIDGAPAIPRLEPSYVKRDMWRLIPFALTIAELSMLLFLISENPCQASPIIYTCLIAGAFIVAFYQTFINSNFNRGDMLLLFIHAATVVDFGYTHFKRHSSTSTFDGPDKAEALKRSVLALASILTAIYLCPVASHVHTFLRLSLEKIKFDLSNQID